MLAARVLSTEDVSETNGNFQRQRCCLTHRTVQLWVVPSKSLFRTTPHCSVLPLYSLHPLLAAEHVTPRREWPKYAGSGLIIPDLPLQTTFIIRGIAVSLSLQHWFCPSEDELEHKIFPQLARSVMDVSVLTFVLLYG